MNPEHNIKKFLGFDKTAAEGRDEVRHLLEEYLAANHSSDGKFLYTLAFITVFAIILFVVTLPAFFMFRKQPDTRWVIATTGRGEKKEVVLPDSSHVWLNSSSEILYPECFTGDERKIYAYGEIFADVTKDKRRPFVVESDGFSVLVHGTRFNVRAYRESEIREIYLERGSVSLHLEGVSADILMQPSDMVRYNVSSNFLEKYNVSPHLFPNWRESSNLSFINMTFSDIIDQLRRTFDTDIIVSGKVSADTRYYGSFINGEDVFQILSALNADGMLKLRKEDNCIVVTPNNYHQ